MRDTMSAPGRVTPTGNSAPTFRVKPLSAAIGMASVMLLAGMSGGALAKKVCDDGGSPPCNKPGGGGKPPTEAGANNLSFPLILSENVGPAGFPADGAWRFAEITNPPNDPLCIGEEGVASGTPVPADFLCYYGRKWSSSSRKATVGENRFDAYPEEPAGCSTTRRKDASRWLQKAATISGKR